jgi:integrase
MAKARLRWKAVKAEEWRKIPAKRRLKRTIRGADIEGHYSLEIYDPETGKRRYEFPGLHTSKDALRNDEQESLAQEFAVQFQDMKWREAHGYPSEVSVPFLDYFRSLVKGRHKAWRGMLYVLETFPEAMTPLQKINYEWLSNLQAHLLSERDGRKLSQSSASTYYAKVKAALALAMKQELITSNPAERIKGISAVPAQRVYLNHEEIQALANTPCLDTEGKRAFLFGCYTGLRISDIRALTWKQYSNNKLELRIKKTGEPEYMPLSSMAMKLLGVMPDDEHGQRSSARIFSLPADGTLWTYLQAWASAAGLSKHISMHTARHTFATLALTETGNLYLVSKLLGHSDIKHTQVYAKIIDHEKRDAVESLPAIELS